MRPVILTIDLGTSATKVVVWSPAGAVAVGRAEVATLHPRPGWAEQDPADWWASVVEACAQARGLAAEAWSSIEAVGFSAASESVFPVDEAGLAIGHGLLWSDRRAADEARALAEGVGGVEAARQRTGVVLDAGSTAAKAAWLARHDAERLRRARWLLSPRDLAILRLTGIAATDATLASRTGFYDHAGTLLPEIVGPRHRLLPDVHASSAVIGGVLPEPAAVLDVVPGTPVVIGAGDRACEVLGTAAGPERAMVSWGTTVNVSVPLAGWPADIPPGLSVSWGAPAGFLLEAGLSAAGAALDWLKRLTGTPPLELAQAAAASGPGARGVVAVPWFNGARAPWWRDSARAALCNLTPAHRAGDLARALYEAVAFDVARSLEAAGRQPAELAAAGGGAAGSLWVELLAAVHDRPVLLRRSGEAASAGACLLVAGAVGREADYPLDRINPVVQRFVASRALTARYRELRPLADRVAHGILAMDLGEWGGQFPLDPTVA